MVSEAFHSIVFLSGIFGTLDLSAVLPQVFDSPFVLSGASVSTIALSGFYCVCFGFLGLSICQFASTPLSERCF